MKYRLHHLDVLKAGGPYIGPRGGKWADAKHTIPWKEKTPHGPKIQALVADAKAAGVSVEPHGTTIDLVVSRHPSGRILRGLRIHENGMATDLTVDLVVAKAIRSVAVMRKLLRLPAKPGSAPKAPRPLHVNLHPAIFGRAVDRTYHVTERPDGTVKLSQHGPDGHGPVMPKESLKHFRNDLAGRVELPPAGRSDIDAVLEGKAQLLGKGDDGMVFKVGDQVVKVSTTVPYQPDNPGHRSPEQAIQMLRAQAVIGNLLADKVAGIQRSEFVRHGDKGFQIKPYVEIPEKWSKTQLDQIQDTLIAMHRAGYSLNDSVQAGLDAKGEPVMYDVGKAAPIPEGDAAHGIYSRVQQDMDRLQALYREHGQPFLRRDYDEGEHAWQRIKDRWDTWLKTPALRRLARRHVPQAADKRRQIAQQTLEGKALETRLAAIALDEDFALAELEQAEESDLAKAGPFIGPRGGKWADPQHKIPWREPEPKQLPLFKPPAPEPPQPTLADLQRELDEVNARIDAAYWTFTRTARGVPPILAVPDAYRRRRELQDLIRDAKPKRTLNVIQNDPALTPEQRSLPPSEALRAVQALPAADPAQWGLPAGARVHDPWEPPASNPEASWSHPDYGAGKGAAPWEKSPDWHPDLHKYDWLVANSSAGKDSQGMLDHLVKLADRVGFPRDKILVVHADLGRVEWQDTAKLAREQAEHYGLRFEVVQREQNDLLGQIEERHGDLVQREADVGVLLGAGIATWRQLVEAGPGGLLQHIGEGKGRSAHSGEDRAKKLIVAAKKRRRALSKRHEKQTAKAKRSLDRAPAGSKREAAARARLAELEAKGDPWDWPVDFGKSIAWPSADSRYCTSDHKRAEVKKLLTKLAGEAKQKTGRPGRILNALGIRAQESDSRAAMPAFERETDTANQTVDRWYPIHRWPEARVWRSIVESGVPFHKAYSLGMRRLSCVFCVFAQKEDLLIAAKHNPGLFRAYLELEEKVGASFKADMSLADVQAEIARRRAEGYDLNELAQWVKKALALDLGLDLVKAELEQSTPVGLLLHAALTRLRRAGKRPSTLALEWKARGLCVHLDSDADSDHVLYLAYPEAYNASLRAAAFAEEAGLTVEEHNSPAPLPELHKSLQKAERPAGRGWSPIPKGHRGGLRRRKGSGWEYWYPDEHGTAGRATTFEKIKARWIDKWVGDPGKSEPAAGVVLKLYGEAVSHVIYGTELSDEAEIHQIKHFGAQWKRDARRIYEDTQRKLKAKGITRSKLYRGVSDYQTSRHHLPDGGVEAEIATWPLSSWASDPEPALYFAGWGKGSDGRVAVTEIPTSAIFLDHRVEPQLDAAGEREVVVSPRVPPGQRIHARLFGVADQAALMASIAKADMSKRFHIDATEANWLRQVRAHRRKLTKAGPYIGPRGGKWADAAHTIPWADDHHAEIEEDGVHFATGKAATVKVTHRKQKTAHFGSQFGQDIEPHGRYVVHGHLGKPGKTVEPGGHVVETVHDTVHFKNPLVIHHKGTGSEPGMWKRRLSDEHGGKKGKALSRAIAKKGHDAIITVDKYGTSEIVDLTRFHKSQGYVLRKGPYIGPRGGKWANPKHTIPWHEPKAKRQPKQLDLPLTEQEIERRMDEITPRLHEERLHIQRAADMGVRYYASGSNHPGEILGLTDVGIDVGVAVHQLHRDAPAAMVAAAKKHPGSRFFVDSGAFSEVKIVEGRPVLAKPISHEKWLRRLSVYESLAKDLGAQLFAVAPDAVGHQNLTLARMRKYAPQMQAVAAHGARVLVPIQKGDVSMAEFWRLAKEALGIPEAQLVASVPMQKDATDIEEYRAFVHDAQPARVHLLGMGAKSARLDAAVAATPPETELSCDSVLIGSLVGWANGPNKGPRILTTIMASVSQDIEENLYHGHLFDMVGWDWTDVAAEPSAWLKPAGLRALAKDLGLKGAEAKALVKDPEAWLQEDDRYLDPRVEHALDKLWRKAMVQIRGQKESGKLTTEQRKYEGIRRLLGPLEKAERAARGPYIGPRGGKWADPQHKVPWKEPKRRRRSTAQERTILAVEEQIRHEPVEHVIGVAPDGRELFRTTDGERGLVRVTSAMLRLCQSDPGTVVTHNHPLAGTLSKEDILLAILTGIAEIRAVTPDGAVWRVRRPAAGWPVPMAAYSEDSMSISPETLKLMVALDVASFIADNDARKRMDAHVRRAGGNPAHEERAKGFSTEVWLRIQSETGTERFNQVGADWGGWKIERLEPGREHHAGPEPAQAVRPAGGRREQLPLIETGPSKAAPKPVMRRRRTGRRQAEQLTLMRGSPMLVIYDLVKGVQRGGKYIRRVPYRDPKTGKMRFRYYYRESAAARSVRAGETVQLGSTMVQVKAVHEDGSITMSIDGRERVVKADAWAEMLAKHYGDRYYSWAEKRATQAVNAVLRIVPRHYLADLKGATDAERLEDLKKRLPNVYRPLAKAFQRAGIGPAGAKEVLSRTLERRGWVPEARAAVIGSVIQERRTPFRQLIRAAENLAGGKRVELAHVSAALELRPPKREDRLADDVKKLAQSAEKELAALSAALAKAHKGGTPEQAAEVLKQALGADNLHKLQLLAQAFPGIQDKAIEPGREALLQVPAVSPRPATTRDGAHTLVYVAGENGQPKALKARYKLVEASEVIPSHDPKTFARSDAYPEGLQERAYHRDQAEQAKVIRNAQNLNPAFVVNTNPDAVNGPPMMTPAGIVLGGNSRAMSMQLALSEYPEKAAALKQYLMEHAHEVGFHPDDVKGLKNPMLVRVVEPEDTSQQGLKVLVRAMNESFTQAMDPRTMQVAMGRRLTEENLNALAQDMGEEETLNAFLSSSRAERFINTLFRAGIIDARNYSQYIRKGTRELNSDGKDLVSRILVGRIIEDADVLSDTGARMVEAVAQAIPPITAAAGYGKGYDLGREIKVALEAFNALQRKADAEVIPALDPKMKPEQFERLDNYFKDLFGNDHEVLTNKRAKMLLEVLIRKRGPVQMAKLFRDYAKRAKQNPEGQTGLMGQALTPEQVLELTVKDHLAKSVVHTGDGQYRLVPLDDLAMPIVGRYRIRPL